MKALIERSYQLGVGIGEHKESIGFVDFFTEPSEFLMLLRAETASVIAGIGLMVGRVKVVEVFLLWLQLLKRMLFNLSIFESVGAGIEIFFVKDRRFLVGANGNIEKAALVHPIKAVETGLIQIDKKRGDLDGVFLYKKTLTALKKILLVVFGLMDFQVFDKLVHMVAYSLKGNSKVKVNVGQIRLFGFHGEEQGRATQERLMVGLVDFGEAWSKLGQDGAFASHPLHKRTSGI
jgi:hypothetical protein